MICIITSQTESKSDDENSDNWHPEYQLILKMMTWGHTGFTLVSESCCLTPKISNFPVIWWREQVTGTAYPSWVFSEVRDTRSLVLYVCFVDRCLSFCPFSFGHCVVCPSSIYGFWLPIWYLQTLLTFNKMMYALYQINMLSWIFIVLTHWNNSRPVDIVALFWHIVLIPR